jgi:hypothetical protein
MKRANKLFLVVEDFEDSRFMMRRCWRWLDMMSSRRATANRP